MQPFFIPDTPRIRFSPVAPDDFDFIHRLQNDPVIMRYIRPPEPDPEVIQKRIAMYLEYAENNPGLGVFISRWKETGQPVGNCVVRHVDYQPGNDLEVGYLLIQEYWGQGLATEITRTLAQYAFDQFDVPKVVAVTDPDNKASQNVLLKCGFRLVGKRFIYDSDNLEFVLER